MKPSLAPFEPTGPCLGLLEIDSVALGFEVADRVAKKAPVQLLVCEPVTPGKFLVLFSGEVEEVASSLRAGADGLSEELLLDRLFLPHVDPGVVEAIGATRLPESRDALGVVETRTVSTLIAAADVAVKTAAVRLVAIRLAMRLHGKAYLVLGGEVSQVRAGVNSAATYADERDHLLAQIVIPRPHGSLWSFL